MMLISDINMFLIYSDGLCNKNYLSRRVRIMRVMKKSLNRIG